jgi:hypothetical protein
MSIRQAKLQMVTLKHIGCPITIKRKLHFQCKIIKYLNRNFGGPQTMAIIEFKWRYPPSKYEIQVKRVNGVWDTFKDVNIISFQKVVDPKEIVDDGATWRMEFSP